MVVVCAAGIAVAMASGLLSTASKIIIFVLVNLILAFDVIDLLVRVWLRRLHGATERGPSLDLGLPEISNCRARPGAATLRAGGVDTKLCRRAGPLPVGLAGLQGSGVADRRRLDG